MKPFAASTIDDLVHSRVRLAILAFLSTADTVDFTTLRDEVGITDGNLSLHLKKLEESGYVKSTKAFYKKRPRTSITMTAMGRKSFYEYLNRLQSMLSRVPDRPET